MAVIGALCLGGCTSAAAPVSVSTPVADSHDEDANDTTVAPQGSCTFTASRLIPGVNGDATPLRIEGDDEPFALLYDGKAELKVSAGRDPNALPLRIEHHGVTLHGVVRAHHIGLRLRRAVTFERIAIPQPATVLGWGGFSENGKPVLVHTLREGVEPDKLRAEVSCDDISLDRTSFDARAAAKGPDGRWGRLLFDQVVPLAAELRGPARAYLTGEDVWDTIVREVTFDGGYSRIVWERPRDVVLGWVPGSALSFPESAPTTLPEEELEFPGPPTETGSGKCARDVELFAVVAGKKPRLVGTVAAGTSFDIGGESIDKFTDVHALVAFEQSYVLTSEATLMARTEDVAGCAPTP